VFNTSALTPGTYLVRFKTGPQGLTANYNCVAVSDTSIIEIVEFPRVTLNESVCLGNTYNFFGHYVGLPGTYDTLVKDGPNDLCGSLYTLNLTVKPLPDVTVAGPDKVDICEGDTANLQVLNPSASNTYQWIKDGAPVAGETSDLYKTTNTGFYRVAAQRDGCVDTSDRITVTERALPVASILYDGELLCSYDTLTFLAEKQVAGTYYNWTPERAFRMISGAENPEAKGTFTENTMVYLKVYSPFGCSTTDSVLAQVHPCCMALVPTAFSPNGDGLNDYFNPVLDFGQKLLTLKIFDRYGKMVYNNNNLQKGWDGKYMNGEPASQEVYMYMMQYTCGNDELNVKRGDLILMR
jgi:gliding motility-associated-like protein